MLGVCSFKLLSSICDLDKTRIICKEDNQVKKDPQNNNSSFKSKNREASKITKDVQTIIQHNRNENAYRAPWNLKLN